jgi:hypothetical protein
MNIICGIPIKVKQQNIPRKRKEKRKKKRGKYYLTECKKRNTYIKQWVAHGATPMFEGAM